MNNISEEIARPRVLILLATYNGFKWLPEQIKSIQIQEGVDFFIAVSDDCSKDGTADILRSLQSEFSNISVIFRQTGAGTAGANFRSLLRDISFSGYDFVAFCDQDDVWRADHLIYAITSMKVAGADGCSAPVRTFGAGAPLTLYQSPAQTELDYLFEGAGQGCSYVFTTRLATAVKSVCLEKKAVEALHYHDWLVYLCARRLNFKWIFLDRIALDYRQHGSNEIGARGSRAALLQRLSLIRSGWFRAQVAAALDLAVDINSPTGRLEKFFREWVRQDSVGRRFRLAIIIFYHSRRKRSERIFLAGCAILGWLK